MEDCLYTDPFGDMFKWIIIFVTFTFIIIGVFMYVNYNESKDACDSFGGRLSGNFNCVKDGVSYNIEQLSPFSLKMQVVRKAVDINEVNYEVSK